MTDPLTSISEGVPPPHIDERQRTQILLQLFAEHLADTTVPGGARDLYLQAVADCGDILRTDDPRSQLSVIESAKNRIRGLA